jgi:hypothetical protein
MVAPVRALASLSATVVLIAGLVGCATQTPAGNAPATTGSSPPPSPCQPDPSGATRTVTEADSGSAVCLAVGQRLEVYLHGTLADRWAPISLEGKALSLVASGKGTLAIGVTGGFFVGSATGDAHLTSSRSTCDDSSPTPTSCGRTMFTVDVQVR